MSDKKGLGKLLKEFKDFALKGNVLDLAVGVMVGGAFNKIVTSLVNDIFMPFIGVITGGHNLAGAFYALDGQVYASIEAAKEAGVGTLNYGQFCQTIIDFVLTALCVFIIVKTVNTLGKMRKKDEPKPAPKPEPRLCPFCKMEVAKEATRCPHCTSELK